MATPLRHIVDDIETDLKQVLDDQTITKAQIAYWVIIVGNNILSEHIKRRDSGAFLSTFILPVNRFQTNKNPNEVKDRYYFRLPGSIFDYNKDAGISFIAYYRDKAKPGCPPEFTKTTFSRTTPAQAEALYMNRYEKPSESNPYFYRVHDIVYLLGTECIPMTDIEVGLFLCIPPVTEIDLDAPFDFPEERIEVLKRRVLDLGRFSLLLPQERINDGAPDTKASAVPTNKLVSVNSINQDQQEQQ